ncbi:MAG: alginate export family protein [Gammaproteobacteria bacterium]
MNSRGAAVRCMMGSAVAAVMAAAAMPASAEYTFYENGGFKANAGLSAIAGAIGTSGIKPIGDRQAYYEAFLKPNVNFTWDMPTEGTIYGKVSGVGVYQGGDGDPSGATNGDVGDLGLEEAYLGWRGDYLDVRAGRTEFAIGDQFLIGDCHFDANGAGGRADAHYDGSYWVAPYKACDSSFIASVNNGGHWRADAFYIKGDLHQAYTRIGGLNVEYLLGDKGADGKFGFMAAAIPESTDFLTRQGMEILDFRANSINVPMVPGLQLHGEIAAETGSNDSAGVKYDAMAYYGEADYTFSNVTWTPTVAYRYGHWDGDDDLTDSTVGNFDSLFYYAGPRGWGTWYQGEIAGEYQLFNSNQNTHMVKLAVHPLDTVTVTGLYFNHSLDEKQYFGTPTTSRGWLDEINLVAEWTPISSLYIAGIVGYGFTGDAYEEIYGTKKDPAVYELWVQYTYVS